ncbi:MAG: hypothetical protein QCI82_08070 [Candidatus Thermoplasmatota archaeon]|nr:hypothetical protein [Candidatus Thermoplasmatota archaeon]
MTVDAVEVQEMQPPRGLSLGPIIAIVVALILLSSFMFFLFWSPDVKVVSVINPEDVDTNGDGGYDSIRFTLVSVKDGFRGLDESARITIRHEGQVVHSADKNVKNEQTYVDIKYDSFVVGNGLYEIEASVGDASDKSDYIAAFVPTSLNMTIQEMTDPLTGEYAAFVVVTPLFSLGESIGKGFNIERFHKAYQMSVLITDPNGEELGISRYMHEERDLNDGNYSEIFRITSGIMGWYGASASMVNQHVKADSQYRTIYPEGGDATRFINRPPVITQFNVVTSRIRVNQEMEVTCRALDPDSNGGLTSLMINWDDDDEIYEYELTTNPATINLKHTYTKVGRYNITVSVADNGPAIGADMNHIRFASSFRIVEVNLI